ncbi:MAG: anthranilate phosphoribosyltransferase [Myxococcota bacterium]
MSRTPRPGSDALREALGEALAGREVAGPTMRRAMSAVLAGEASDAQIGGFAIALRMRGETPGELAAAAAVLRQRARGVSVSGQAPLLDTCGTGGDGLGTFNISTVAALVAAAAGARVAKHGNRAVSSRCGSADVLEALGLDLNLDRTALEACLGTVGIAFLFAPAHHGALRHAAGARRALGVRTLFNLLGPLANPAGATHQLLGVYDEDKVEDMAEVLGALGTQAAWVVHGTGGFDEIATTGATRVARLRRDDAGRARVDTFELTPGDFGLEEAPAEALAGGDATTNARIAREVLAGQAGAPRLAVLLNAGAALCVAGVAATPREGAERAAAAIAGGAAARLLARWVEFTTRRGTPVDD